jgi:phosphohistidine phosphatase
MNLYFMRHGIASAADDSSVVNDDERPLSPKGMKRTRKIAKGICRLDIPFDALLTSPLTRARQTANIVAAALAVEAPVEEIASLAPNSAFDQLLADLGSHRDRKHLLLVSHEPFLSDALSFLLAGQSAARLDLEFRKGALCRIEIDSPSRPHPGRLHWFLTPKQLRRLG